MDAEPEARSRHQLEGLNRQLEQRVEEQRQELATSETQRRAAEEKLKHSQKMEAIRQLTGGVAHDFNNLLTVIRGSIDFLRRPELPEEKRTRYLDAIAQTAERAQNLTEQLLAFARRQPLDPTVFDVSERIRAMGDVLRTVIGSNIKLDLRFECPDCFIKADRDAFETSLVNLVVNARDAMPDGGTVTILLSDADGIPPAREHPPVGGQFLCICVKDNGTGIPSEVMERIFEPFFTTKRVGKGTGLGLSQVYGFAKQSGGEIIAESAPGNGSTFCLYLPRADRPKESEQAKLPFTDSLAALEGVKGCILVVEDNELVGQFATQLLADLGFDSVWAADAQAALDLLDEKPDGFDLVLTDVVMPGMSGIELATRVRDLKPELPVVLTSGYSDVLARQGTHGFELLKKPYSLDGLGRILRVFKVSSDSILQVER